MNSTNRRYFLGQCSGLSLGAMAPQKIFPPEATQRRRR